MQRKLKSFFRRPGSHKQGNRSDIPAAQLSQEESPSIELQPPSPQSSRGRTMSVYVPKDDSSRTESRQAGSRNESQDRHISNSSLPAIVDYGQPENEANNGAIAENYKAYLYPLSEEDDSKASYFMTLGGDRRLITGESELRYSEDVANRNIERYGTKSGNASPRRNSINEGKQSSPDPTRKGSVSNVSVASPSSVGSANTDESIAKYVVGRNIATRGGLIDGILPAVQATGDESRPWNRADWPARIARDESQLHQRRQKRRANSKNNTLPEQRPRESPRDEKPPKLKGELTDLRKAVMDGQQDNDIDIRSQIGGIVDLSNSEVVKKSTRWEPAVTHEAVKPTVHHITEEQIYREIHNYDVYHRIQPVRQTEVLPTRHFVPSPNGHGLIEVSEDQLPDCTGINQAWFIGTKEPPKSNYTSNHIRFAEPKVIADKTYMTPEGFERRETTILHPPTLADVAQLGVPVLPVHFDDITGECYEGEVQRLDKLNYVPDARPLTLKELTESLPTLPSLTPIPTEMVPPRKSSVRHSRSS